MKKFLITALIIWISATIIFAATPSKKEKPSDYKLGITYEQAMKSDKPALLLFYTDWCTYCRRFMPTYEKLSNLYKDKYNIVMVNAESNSSLSREYNISGFPTLYIIDPKIDNRVHLDNGIYSNMYLLQKEINRYSNVRARIK